MTAVLEPGGYYAQSHGIHAAGSESPCRPWEPSSPQAQQLINAKRHRPARCQDFAEDGLTQEELNILAPMTWYRDACGSSDIRRESCSWQDPQYLPHCRSELGNFEPSSPQAQRLLDLRRQHRPVRMSPPTYIAEEYPAGPASGMSEPSSPQAQRLWTARRHHRVPHYGDAHEAPEADRMCNYPPVQQSWWPPSIHMRMQCDRHPSMPSTCAPPAMMRNPLNLQDMHQDEELFSPLAQNLVRARHDQETLGCHDGAYWDAYGGAHQGQKCTVGCSHARGLGQDQLDILSNCGPLSVPSCTEASWPLNMHSLDGDTSPQAYHLRRVRRSGPHHPETSPQRRTSQADYDWSSPGGAMCASSCSGLSQAELNALAQVPTGPDSDAGDRDYYRDPYEPISPAPQHLRRAQQVPASPRSDFGDRDYYRDPHEPISPSPQHLRRAQQAHHGLPRYPQAQECYLPTMQMPCHTWG